ncbi:MAG: sialate O-acetylesterase [Marinoscillum sp.]
MNTIKHLAFLIIMLVGFTAFSQTSVSALFSDNMVLQRNTDVKIWGSEDSKSVSITTSWNDEPVKVKVTDGKWSTSIKTPDAGGPYELTIRGKETRTIKNIMIGDVWLCTGQSNMEMPMKGFMGQPITNSNEQIIKSRNPNIRHIEIPRKSTTLPQSEFEGEWKEASISTTGEFSATAYYFAKLVNEITAIPIGLINVTYGGSNVEAWMNEETLSNYPEVEFPENDEAIGDKNRTPTVLFNGMLNPVIGYTIKGAIWYQGESNAERPIAYETLFPEMVKLWRAKWNQGDFPFYYTQIAPFDYDVFYTEPKPWFANSAYLRDAQRKSQYIIPNSGMTTLLDAGDMLNIHPMDKQTPGERLAWLALAKTYGYEGFGYATPDYDELNIEDSLVTVTFKNLPNGITSYGKEVTAFEIAGEDKVFYPAQCKVRRKSVQVWSDQVEKPVAIRYAFTNEGPAQLFSNEGIPVSTFRTDNWNPSNQ